MTSRHILFHLFCAGLLCISLTSRAQVAPLVTTAWHQTAPYNAYCPDGTLAGCVAVAMAQVMNFHKYPERGKGKNSYKWSGKTLSADFAATTYRWSGMETNTDAAAELIYHCGVAVWMDYSPSFSGSNEYYAKSALVDFFSYSDEIKQVARNKYSDEEWAGLLREQLDLRQPVIYSSGGHTFVVDGYNADGLFHANMGYGYTGGKSYYTVNELGSKSSSTAVINIKPEGGQTAIKDVAATPHITSKTIYDLSGRTVSPSSRTRIIIKEGKKILR